MHHAHASVGMAPGLTVPPDDKSGSLLRSWSLDPSLRWDDKVGGIYGYELISFDNFCYGAWRNGPVGDGVSGKAEKRICRSGLLLRHRSGRRTSKFEI